MKITDEMIQRMELDPYDEWCTDPNDGTINVGMNYHHRQHRKWFLQYQCSIVRLFTVPLLRWAKPFGILVVVVRCACGAWELNTLYILRAIGSWFVRFVTQPYIYSFQGSDILILSRTVVRVKAIHPTSDFVGRGFLARNL